MIIPSLPAAASNSDCRRHSHPDCRATLGFPLHPVGKPSDDRAAHLFDINIPMLFLQGTRDKLADLPLLNGLVERLGPRAPIIRSTCPSDRERIIAWSWVSCWMSSQPGFRGG
jgi:hypothetical protein